MIVNRLIFRLSIACHKFSTSSICHGGKRNVRKFPLFAFRWTRDFKERQAVNPDPDIPVYKYGVKEPSYNVNGKTVVIPEMIPELVVPNLKNCDLKPYVSYKAPDVVQSEFSAQDLFDAVYSRKIEVDFREGKLDQNGLPIEPSEAEKLTPEVARRRARQTGCDLFTDIKSK